MILAKQAAPYLLLSYLLVLASCSFTTENNTKRKVKAKEMELILTGRDGLNAELSITEFEKKNCVFAVKIDSDSCASRRLIWKTQSLHAGITKVLKALTKIPYQRPESATYIYKNKRFELVDAKAGAQLDTAMIRTHLKQLSAKKKLHVDLHRSNFYVKPTYVNECAEIKEAKKALDKCLKSIITLTSENKEYKLDQKIFGPWLKLDESLRVIVDTASFVNYLLPIAQEVDPPISEITAQETPVDTSQIASAAWPTHLKLNVLSETVAISKLILSGLKSKRELVLSNVMLPNAVKQGLKDFVEISIDNQQMWVFKNGCLVVETAIVTGDRKRKRDTPKGSYHVKYKARNVTLKGRDYEAFVYYWMPFYGGYGLHDANWRRSFGGTIYTRSGSHGCVNMPSKISPLVYELVKVGTPVIVR